jgi:bacterioferritin-associated ferredoxin
MLSVLTIARPVSKIETQSHRSCRTKMPVRQQTIQADSACRTCPAGVFVCHCYEVTEVAIRSTIESIDAQSVEEVTLHTRAGAGCTACHCRIRRMLAGLAPTCGPFETCAECGYDQDRCECKMA